MTLLPRVGKRKGESRFLTEVKNSLELLYPDKSFSHKMSDMFPAPEEFDRSGARIAQKFDRKGRQIQPLRFLPKKPFDCFWIAKGVSWYFEAKFHESATSAWPFSDVSEGQFEALMKVHNAEAYAGVLVNVREGVGNARLNVCYVIPIILLKAFMDKGKKSFTQNDFRRDIPYIEWIWSEGDQKYLWEVTNKRLKNCFSIAGSVLSGLPKGQTELFR